MKKTHLLYSLGVALLALPACTDKEIAPEDATQRPADGFLFRPETRADGIPIIDGNRQWIEKVSMTKGLDDSERKEFPNPNEQGDLSTYDARRTSSLRDGIRRRSRLTRGSISQLLSTTWVTRISTG